MQGWRDKRENRARCKLTEIFSPGFVGYPGAQARSRSMTMSKPNDVTGCWGERDVPLRVVTAALKDRVGYAAHNNFEL